MLFRSDIPAFAVCRGEQMMGIVHGVTFIQDLPVYYQSKGVYYDGLHRAPVNAWGRDYVRHDVTLLPLKSHLREIVGADKLENVSSWHHQAIRSVEGTDLIQTAETVDKGGVSIIEVYPEMGPFLMEYGMSCVGCFVSYDETLWQAAQGHGIDVFEIIGEMNEFIADKYKKPLLTEDTPMETILTLYPQLLPVFQKKSIAMPQDMKTTIGTLCKEANVDAKDLIALCDERLRGKEEA